MIKNLIWVSIIIILLGLLFYIFYLIYEKSKANASNGQSSILVRVKFQYYILIFMLVLGVAVSGFFYLNNRKLFKYYAIDDGVDSSKSVLVSINDNKYDRCVAYGNLIDLHDLIELDILSEAEEKQLLDSRSIWNQSPSYNIAFVQKGDDDYLVISNQKRPHDSYMFKSHLPYSFADLIELFAEAADTELTDEFLNGNDTGIFFSIINLHVDYFYTYVLEIDGRRYYAYYDDQLRILT